MSLPVDKYRSLCIKLYNSTNDKTLSWQINPFTGDVFTELGSHRVVISSGDDAEGSPFIRISLTDGSGDTVDSFVDTTVSGGATGIPGMGSFWTLLSSLANMAYRQAKGADKALDDILDALDDNVPF
jgi:hypothetical protein